MVKQRRPVPRQNSEREPPRSSKMKPKRVCVRAASSLASRIYTVCGCIAVVVGSYFAYQGYLETRVNSPLGVPSVVKKSDIGDESRFWGSYRPGLYFGMRPRSPRSITTGLMWFIPAMVRPNHFPLRHWCDQGDGLLRYGWVEHDGKTFGLQEIRDQGISIDTSFVKSEGGDHGGDWTARITAVPQTKSALGQIVSLLFYTYLEDGAEGEMHPKLTKTRIEAIQGRTKDLGDWLIRFPETDTPPLHSYHFVTQAPGAHMLRETVISGLVLNQGTDHPSIGLVGTKYPPGSMGKPNLIVHQVEVQVPYTLEVVFLSGSKRNRQEILTRDTYSKALRERRHHFSQKFEDVFGLREKGYSDSEIAFAKAAMSNMVGGIGYFYGSSRVQSVYNKDPVPYWEAPLYSAVPSRSFFPRGFLWDEGFHNLLISQWDPEISKDIIGHWMDLLNVEGWIPREQILGEEARSRVPSEFIVQKNTNANPPTLILPLHYLVRHIKMNIGDAETIHADDREFLEYMWPRLVSWYRWFNTTQLGELPGTYRWRGRDSTTQRELNPKTLTSGLDDYPRASHPSVDERHVDLRCWMAMASRLMADIAILIGKNEEQYQTTYEYLSDNFLLDELHWSSRSQAYMDYGLHSDSVVLKRPKPPPPRPDKPHVQMEKVRVVNEEPKLQFVESFGYVSLFPFLLQLVDPNSLKLGKILSDLRDTSLLWTPYGLRSLAKNAPLYMKSNTEHDPPYWRGPIWINLNFLAVKALHHYGNQEGPYQEQAKDIYNQLRTNLIRNIYNEYKRTGYLWEQYNDSTGEGQGCRPFTGWTSLVVLLMAESY